jgi:hypothetical protein
MLLWPIIRYIEVFVLGKTGRSHEKYLVIQKAFRPELVPGTSRTRRKHFSAGPAFFAGCDPLTVRGSVAVLLHPESINVLLIRTS